MPVRMRAISFILNQREIPNIRDILKQQHHGYRIKGDTSTEERRGRKKEGKGKGRHREAGRGRWEGGARKRARDQWRSWKGERVLLVSALSLYSRRPLWSYSREQTTSPSDLARSHSLEHTQTHTSVRWERERAAFLPLPCVALNDMAVCECPHLIIHPSPPTSLPLTVFTPPLLTCLPAACNKNTEISKDQPAFLSLSSPSSLYSPLCAHTATEKHSVSWG